MTPEVRVDVVVAGAGPAGLAVAAELAVRGVSVAVVDPHPGRPWRATHCGWADELAAAPGFDPVRSVLLRHRAVVVDGAGSERVLDRPYVQLDPAGAPAALRRRAADAPVPPAAVGGRVGQLAADGNRVAVTVLPGRDSAEPHSSPTAGLSARVVVDATGSGGTVAGDTKPASAAGLWQWAVGLVTALDPVPAGPGAAVLMDWRQHRPGPHTEAGPADAAVPHSFGYVLDRGDGTWLVEETVLAGPRVRGVMRVLRARLSARLAARGWRPAGPAREELVAIPLDTGPRGAAGPVLPVGVAAGLVHPASGYSVTASLRTAPAVADAVADALADPGASPELVAAAGAEALWTPAARRGWALLDRGVRSTLALDAAGTAAFYDAFFALPTRLWGGYLAQPPDPGAVRAAMAGMVATLPRRDAVRLVRRWLAAGRSRRG